jgi:hypothetical protein
MDGEWARRRQDGVFYIEAGGSLLVRAPEKLLDLRLELFQCLLSLS